MTYNDRCKLAKQFCKASGFTGKKGGWIYNQNGKPVIQGYAAFYDKYLRTAVSDADRIAKLYSHKH